MADKRPPILRRLLGGANGDSADRQFDRLEQKCRVLERATRDWLTLLREMEQSGETNDPRYETYYRAYLEAKRQEDHAQLQLFNLRRGLTES